MRDDDTGTRRSRRGALGIGACAVGLAQVAHVQLAAHVLADSASPTPTPAASPTAVTPAPTPTVPLPPAPDLAVLCLNRLAFGPRIGDLAAFAALPGTPHEQLAAWVDQQLAPQHIDDQACASALARVRLRTLHTSLPHLWADYIHASDKDLQRWDKIYRPVMETRKATFIRAVYSRRQLAEVLVDFWHNHFNTNPDRDENLYAPFMSYDRDVIRVHALGNFRTLLEAVATHPEMLYYLDNATSARSGPNENYGRELFELHTLGVDNYLGVGHQSAVPGFAQGAPIGYVDDDVYEATRCFTGWRVDDGSGDPGVGNTGRMIYYGPWHDRFQKTVLGRFLPPDQPPMQDGRTVLDLLAAHPGTGRHVAQRLCRRLVGDEPPRRWSNARRRSSGLRKMRPIRSRGWCA